MIRVYVYVVLYDVNQYAEGCCILSKHQLMMVDNNVCIHLNLQCILPTIGLRFLMWLLNMCMRMHLK